MVRRGVLGLAVAWLLLFAVEVLADAVIVFGYGATGRVFVDRVLKYREGLDLVIVDIDPDKLAQAQERLKGRVGVHYLSSIDEVTDHHWQDAVFIQELVTEDVPVKQALLAKAVLQLAQHHNPAPVASNTSSIPATLLARQLPDDLKTRVAVNHLYSPHSAAAEVATLDDSPAAQATKNAVEAFNESLGIRSFRLSNDSLPIRDQLGHSFNRIWFRLKEHFIDMAEQDVVNYPMVDLAFMLIYGRPLGIFGTMDVIGLGTAIHIRDVWFELGGVGSRMPASIIERWQEGRRFYSEEDRPADVAWLAPQRQANLDGMQRYAEAHALADEGWQEKTKQLVKELLASARHLSSREKDKALLQWFDDDEQLQYATFLVAAVTLQEYRHTILENKVLSVEDADALLGILTGQSYFLSRMEKVFQE